MHIKNGKADTITSGRPLYACRHGVTSMDGRRQAGAKLRNTVDAVPMVRLGPADSSPTLAEHHGLTYSTLIVDAVATLTVKTYARCSTSARSVETRNAARDYIPGWSVLLRQGSQVAYLLRPPNHLGEGLGPSGLSVSAVRCVWIRAQSLLEAPRRPERLSLRHHPPFPRLQFTTLVELF